MFTKELGGYPIRTATAHIVPTDAQMAAIARTTEDIGFFDYPSPFNGVPTGVPEVITIAPSVSYRLEIRSGGAVHTVEWNDAYKPTTAAADRLREMMSMVVRIIHEHPEYRRLPPVTVGCM